MHSDDPTWSEVVCLLLNEFGDQSALVRYALLLSHYQHFHSTTH